MSYVFILYNLLVVEYVVDDVMVMDFGSVVEFGDKVMIYVWLCYLYMWVLMLVMLVIFEEDCCV